MARTSNPHEAAIKAWETRGRAHPGAGSNPTRVRSEYFSKRGWSGPRTFTPSQMVFAAREYSEEEVRDFTRKTFGRELSRDDIADLAGAPPESEVQIALRDDSDERRYGGPNIGIYVYFPDRAGACYRVFDPVKKIITNEQMRVDKNLRGKGIGTAVFEVEVETAAKLGLKRIEVEAIGDANSSANGYYTWARLGFEGDVKGPNGDTVKLSKLMSSPEGRDWWKQNGTDFFGTFDLSPTSVSMRVFSEYRRLKRQALESEARAEAGWARE